MKKTFSPIYTEMSKSGNLTKDWSDDPAIVRGLIDLIFRGIDADVTPAS